MRCYVCGWVIKNEYEFCPGCGSGFGSACGLVIESEQEFFRSVLYRGLTNRLRLRNHSAKRIAVDSLFLENGEVAGPDSVTIEAGSSADFYVNLSQSGLRNNYIALNLNGRKVIYPFHAETFEPPFLRFENADVHDKDMLEIPVDTAEDSFTCSGSGSPGWKSCEAVGAEGVRIVPSEKIKDKFVIIFEPVSAVPGDYFCHVDFRYPHLEDVRIDFVIRRFISPDFVCLSNYSFINENAIQAEKPAIDFKLSYRLEPSVKRIKISDVTASSEFLNITNRNKLIGLEIQEQETIAIDCSLQLKDMTDGNRPDFLEITVKYKDPENGRIFSCIKRIETAYKKRVRTEYPVVIDIGTSNSCVALAGGSYPRLGFENTGTSYESTGIYFKNFKRNQSEFGNEAKKLFIMSNFDRRCYASNFKQGLTESRKRYYLDTSQNIKELSTQQIYMQYLQWIKDNIGWESTTVIATFPATFFSRQKKIMLDCFRSVFEKSRISLEMDEPTALASAYSMLADGAETFAVFDVGGGTTDISVCSLIYTGGGMRRLKVIAHGGHQEIAGEYITHRIAKAIHENNDRYGEFPSYRNFITTTVTDLDMVRAVSESWDNADEIKRSITADELQPEDDNQHRIFVGRNVNVTPKMIYDCTHDAVLETVNMLKNICSAVRKKIVRNIMDGLPDNTVAGLLEDSGDFYQLSIFDSKNFYIKDAIISRDETDMSLKALIEKQQEKPDFIFNETEAVIENYESRPLLDKVILCGNGAKFPLFEMMLKKHIRASEFVSLEQVLQLRLSKFEPRIRESYETVVKDFQKLGVVYGAAAYQMQMLDIDMENTGKMYHKDIGLRHRGHFRPVLKKWRDEGYEKSEVKILCGDKIELFSCDYSGDYEKIGLIELMGKMDPFGKVTVPGDCRGKVCVLRLDDSNDIMKLVFETEDKKSATAAVEYE